MSMTNVLVKRGHAGTSLMVQWLRLCAPNVHGGGGALVSIPGQGTRAHLQLMILHTATKIPCAATKTQHRQRNTFLKAVGVGRNVDTE